MFFLLIETKKSVFKFLLSKKGYSKGSGDRINKKQLKDGY